MPISISERRVQVDGPQYRSTTCCQMMEVRFCLLATTEKILLDTDIGNDIDDAFCLAYLLAQPRCELLGITTATGDTQQRAALVDALCQTAGRTDIPIVA